MTEITEEELYGRESDTEVISAAVAEGFCLIQNTPCPAWDGYECEIVKLGGKCAVGIDY
jgi:hypothetical protein